MSTKLEFNAAYHKDQIAKIQRNATIEEAMCNKANAELARLEPILAKMNLKIERAGCSKTGLTPDWLEADSLRVAIRAVRANAKFKFIKDQGYKADGSGVTTPRLRAKAIKMQDKMRGDGDASYNVNYFSLGYEEGHNLDEKSILIDFWVKQD